LACAWTKLWYSSSLEELASSSLYSYPLRLGSCHHAFFLLLSLHVVAKLLMLGVAKEVLLAMSMHSL
jgi:hypothetical protein